MTSPEVLAEYLRIRAAQRVLNKRLVPTLSRKAIEQSAKDLGCWERGALAVEDDSELDLVMDSAIYDHYPSGNKNAVARFGARHELEGDEKLALDAMLRARFTLVELGASVDGIGVYAHDVMFDESLFVADVALSTSLATGVVLATRLLTFDSFAMTTGVHRLFDDRLASLMRTSTSAFAGRAKQLQPRDSSCIARLLLRLAMMDPEDARLLLADMAVAQLPRDDPSRQTYAGLRMPKEVGSPK